VRPRRERKGLFTLVGSTGDEDGLERCWGRYGLYLFEDLDSEFACWSSSKISSCPFVNASPLYLRSMLHESSGAPIFCIEDR
jgi:hypothetical protein